MTMEILTFILVVGGLLMLGWVASLQHQLAHARHLLRLQGFIWDKRLGNYVRERNWNDVATTVDS